MTTPSELPTKSTLTGTIEREVQRIAQLNNDQSREPGQICRDLTCKRFKIAIVLGPSRKQDKLRVCRWQTSDEPSGGHWNMPQTRSAEQLEALPPNFDLTTRRGQVVAAAKRSIINGLVRWQVGPRFHGDKLTEVHNVGTVRP